MATRFTSKVLLLSLTYRFLSYLFLPLCCHIESSLRNIDFNIWISGTKSFFARNGVRLPRLEVSQANIDFNIARFFRFGSCLDRSVILRTPRRGRTPGLIALISRLNRRPNFVSVTHPDSIASHPITARASEYRAPLRTVTSGRDADCGVAQSVFRGAL